MLLLSSIPSLSWEEALLRLALAAALGGAVGLERECREREAGFRTHMLVSLGSALFTIASAYGFRDFLVSGSSVVRADPTRIAAQVVSRLADRGAGNAAIAMRSLWLASLINIFLCPALIKGWGPLPELGLKGAAIATTIGRGIGVLYQCYHLFLNPKSTINLNREHFIIDFPLMRSLIKIAWPATFQFIIASGSWIVLSQLVAKTGGEHASAGYQIAIRNLVFFILPACGLSNAAATLVGQNLGAKRPERAEKSVMLTAKL